MHLHLLKAVIGARHGVYHGGFVHTDGEVLEREAKPEAGYDRSKIGFYNIYFDAAYVAKIFGEFFMACKSLEVLATSKQKTDRLVIGQGRDLTPRLVRASWFRG